MENGAAARFRLVVIAAMWLSVVFVDALPAQNELSRDYEIKSRRVDALTIEREKDRTIFWVTCKFGIGGATVKRLTKEWTKRVVIRLRYEEGRGFGMLESFAIETSRTRTDSRLNGPAHVSVYARDLEAKGQQRLVGEIELPITKDDKFVEISLPSSLLENEEQFTIDWIDAYRG